MCHWDQSALVASSCLTKVTLTDEAVLPSAQPMMSADAADVLMATLPLATRKAMARGDMLCPCTEGDNCTADMNIAGTKVFPPGPVTATWYANVAMGSTELARSLARAGAAVHKNHFLSDDICKVTSAFGNIRQEARDGVRPRRLADVRSDAAQRAVAVDEVESLSSRFMNATLRAATSLLNRLSGSKVEPQHLAQVIDECLVSDLGAAPRSSDSSASPARVDERVVGEVDEDVSDTLLQTVASELRRHSFDVVKTVSSDNGLGSRAGSCRYYTGFDSFEELEAIYGYLNADGAFDTLRMYRTDVANDQDDDGAAAPVRRGRPRALATPRDQFIFWLVMFRRFRGSGMIEHAADLFGISYSTALLVYTTWTIAVGRFFKGQFHPATRSQARDAAFAHALGTLGLTDCMCAFIGDCTERWIQDPDLGALHSALYSQYKSRTTIKYLVITTLDSYISYVPRPANGACTDNGLHIIADVSKLL